jgi:hypothetical protein
VWEVSISSIFNSSSFITPTPFTSSPTIFHFIRYNKPLIDDTLSKLVGKWFRQIIPLTFATHFRSSPMISLSFNLPGSRIPSDLPTRLKSTGSSPALHSYPTVRRRRPSEFLSTLSPRLLTSLIFRHSIHRRYTLVLSILNPRPRIIGGYLFTRFQRRTLGFLYTKSSVPKVSFKRFHRPTSNTIWFFTRCSPDSSFHPTLTTTG